MLVIMLYSSLFIIVLPIIVICSLCLVYGLLCLTEFIVLLGRRYMKWSSEKEVVTKGATSCTFDWKDCKEELPDSDRIVYVVGLPRFSSNPERGILTTATFNPYTGWHTHGSEYVTPAYWSSSDKELEKVMDVKKLKKILGRDGK